MSRFVEIAPEPIRRPGGGRAVDPATRILPGLIVIGLPVVVGAWSLLARVASEPPTVTLDDRWGPAVNLFAVAVDPRIPAMLRLTMPLLVPTILAAIGFGSMARWFTLAAFCAAGTIVFTGITVLLVVSATSDLDAYESGYRVGQAMAIICPFFALECCGCLLAAGFAVRSESA